MREGQISNPVLGNDLQGLLSNNDSSAFLGNFLPRIIGLLLIIGSLIFFFMMLIGAIAWITSGGDKAHVESAKAKITNALIGFILMISTFAIIKIIEAFFGINILLIDIGPLVIE